MATIAEAMTVAVQYHQAGHWPQAEAIYKQILEVDPNHANALHMLGVLAHQQGRNQEAIQMIRQAIGMEPANPAFHGNLGTVLQEYGQVAEAVNHYREALRLRPGYPEAHNNLGNALRELRDFSVAEVHYREAIRLRPIYPEAHNNLGKVLLEQGRLREAAEEYQQAVQLKPDYADAHNNLGAVLMKIGQLGEAVAHYQKVISLDLNRTKGNSEHAGGRLKDQVPLRIETPQSPPTGPPLQPAFGTPQPSHNSAETDTIAAGRRAEEAVDSSGNFRQAIAHLWEALRLNPDSAEAHYHLGLAYQGQTRLTEALTHFDEAIRLQPDHADAHWRKALACLQTGDFEQGWIEFEWRWRRKCYAQRTFSQPPWDGSCLTGRTILLHSEMGLGDTIHFVRYAPLIKDRGGTVVFECPPALCKLLARSPGIDILATPGKSLPAFDVHAPLLSLPGIFGTTLATIPTSIPYVFPDPALVEHWRHELESIPQFKIGIVWHGSYGDSRFQNRSVALAQFAPLARLEGVRLLSLQKGPGTEQLAEYADQFLVTDFGNRLDQASGAFMDTAAIMRHLHLVVSVDTAVGHCAAAMGVPVWVVVPFAPDWRWILGREDTPWYPTMRLFRQSRWGDWDEVFERLAQEVWMIRRAESGVRGAKSR